MSKITNNKIVAVVLAAAAVFAAYNILWFSVTSARYSRFESKTEGGYEFTVEKPGYLKFSGSLRISDGTGGTLVIVPGVFSGYEYTMVLEGDAKQYSFAVDEELIPFEAIDESMERLLDEHRGVLLELFVSAKEYWEI